MFKQATKKASKLRLALVGPSGSGKTFSALSIAEGLGKKIAVIDTEHGSASLYADTFRFDTCLLDTFSPDAYVEALQAAEAAGYEVIIIDSLSHAWMGKDGALEQVDNATRRSGSKNSYFAWRDVTPKHNNLVEAIIQSKAHVIATMRAKTEYTTEKDDKGKVTPRKIGLAPIQRDGMEYEFTVSGELDLEHNYNISKTRCSLIAGKVIQKPGLKLGQTLRAWLEDGAAEEPKPNPAPHQAAPKNSAPPDPGPTVPPPAVTPDSIRQKMVRARTESSLQLLSQARHEAQALTPEQRAELRPLHDEIKDQIIKAQAAAGAQA